MAEPLTTRQITDLVVAEYKKQNGGTPDEKNAGPGALIMVAIAKAESGGYPNATNYPKNEKPPNFDKASTPWISYNNPVGKGKDRGLYQFNSLAWPQISDSDAYDPVKATKWAYTASKGYTDFGPWVGSKGLDKEFQNTVLKDILDVGMGNPLDTAKDFFGDVVDSVVPWADGLAKFLSALTDPTWWKRIGIGVLGALIIIAALIVVFGKDVVSTVSEVKPI